MGNKTDEPGYSDETISNKSEKTPARVKQPVEQPATKRDEKNAGKPPSPSPAFDFMGWSTDATPFMTTLIGSGGGGFSPSMQPFWCPWIQNLNQFNLPPFFQYPGSLQTDPQQNVGPQYNGHGLAAIPFIPIFNGLCGMPTPSNMFPVMILMNMGQPMTMVQGLPQSEVHGGMDIVQEPGHTHGLQGPQGGGAQGAQIRHNNEPPRQANHRFRIGFQLDLLLLLKLAAVVFVFNQDGSRDRLFILLLLAAIVYMYQTGALSPLLCWFSQSAQRAMMPPQQPEHANVAAQGQPLGGAIGRGSEQNEGGHRAQQGLNNRQQPRPPPHGRNWWGLFKEMQMLIVGFVTSLLPGYQHAG